jgi:hypothetical protein
MPEEECSICSGICCIAGNNGLANKKLTPPTKRNKFAAKMKRLNCFLLKKNIKDSIIAIQPPIINAIFQFGSEPSDHRIITRKADNGTN